MRLLSKIVVFISLVSILYSCKSDEELKNDANEFVNKFVNELLLENYDYIDKVYPEFDGFGYWIPREFEISETIIESDESITVYGIYHKNKINTDQIKFNLIQENDSFKIRNTKGLSSYFNSSLYEYCNKKGYFNKSNISIDNDVDVSKVCKDKAFEFEFLIDKCLEDVVSNVHMNKQLSNLSIQFYSSYISGDVQIKNNTPFDIGASQFKFFLLFYSRNKICKTIELNDFPYIHIDPYGNYNHKVYYEENPCNSTYYNIQLQLKDREEFAKEVIENLDYAESL
jgi:hypothetical protein